MSEALLTTVEVAERLHLCPRSVHSLTKTGELPVVRIGRAVRYTPKAVSKFIEAREGYAGRPKRIRRKTTTAARTR